MLPTTWTEALDRLAGCLGGPADAEEWLRQAVRACYGVDSLRDLDRTARHVAFQRTCGVVLALEDMGFPDRAIDGATGRLTLWWRDGTVDPDPDGEEALEPRGRISAVFARYFDGAAVEGPAWAVSATEDRPALDEWADFPADTTVDSGAAEVRV